MSKVKRFVVDSSCLFHAINSVFLAIFTDRSCALACFCSYTVSTITVKLHLGFLNYLKKPGLVIKSTVLISLSVRRVASSCSDAGTWMSGGVKSS